MTPPKQQQRKQPEQPQQQLQLQQDKSPGTLNKLSISMQRSPPKSQQEQQQQQQRGGFLAHLSCSNFSNRLKPWSPTRQQLQDGTRVGLGVLVVSTLNFHARLLVGMDSEEAAKSFSEVFQVGSVCVVCWVSNHLYSILQVSTPLCVMIAIGPLSCTQSFR